MCVRTFLLSLAVPFAVDGAAADFDKDIVPILQRACVECHGMESPKAGLRLDTKSELLSEKGIIVPGNPSQSEMLRRISLPRSDKEAMPRRGKLLNASEIALISAWIQAGAEWPEQSVVRNHWAYELPEVPDLPRVQDTRWPINEVDYFVLERLESEGLSPSPDAAPSVLFRRLSLDITGLPPNQKDTQTFERDYAIGPEKAINQWVDHLLASPEFGVKWARHWLDLARYADSHGYQRDDLRDIWAYRDWVVSALNRSMPFDQFTIEQVAGDLLPSANLEQKIATGFHRCTPTNVEAGTEPEESRINQVIDRVNTTGAVWLGVTLECAQCHDHKYDAFTQRDYYGLLAYFNNTEAEAERADPKVPGSIRFNGSPLLLEDPSLQAEALRGSQVASGGEDKAGVRTEIGARRTLPLRVSTFIAESGSDFERLDDDSVLLTGTAPDVDTYTVEAELPVGPFSGIQLEALSHPSLPGQGPGRGDANRPNFVLDGFEVFLIKAGSDIAVPLAFRSAEASFSQKKFEVSQLISKEGSHAWAINPRFHESHWAVFQSQNLVEAKMGDLIRMVLVQNFGGKRVIGRMRVSVIQGDFRNVDPVAEMAAPTPKKRAESRERMPSDKQLAALKGPTTEIMKELPVPRMTSLFKRGEYTQPGETVLPATPKVIAFKAEPTGNRLALARWLVSPSNPLTARVTVNRWWAEIFGRGIVSTVEDFGVKGEPPTHPGLLDWLATDFMKHGWNMKQTIKKIVTSATYRQSSQFRSPAIAVDPSNALLWRGPRFRMDAEMIRDNALAISGLLSLGKGGPPLRPPQPDGLWKKVGGQQYDYQVSKGEAKHRRGLYVVLKRGSPNPSFMNFDASARMACVVKRSRSNTPLQALTLLNDPVYVEATEAFATRISDQPAAKPSEKIVLAFRSALSRAPTEKEVMVLEKLYEEQVLASNETEAWYAVASAILNLDECITKG